MQSFERAPDNPVYEYSPILDLDGIRLISLRQVRNEQGLGHIPNCIIIHTRLETCPRYEALSYTWGNASEPLIPCPVNGGNSHIMISRNLFCALQHLAAESNEDRYLWADQLCINQRDLIEKGHQVERMTQIYQKSSMTIIWLGEDSSGDAIKLFDMIGRVQSILGNPKNIQSPATGLNNKESETSELFKHGVLDEVQPITRRLLQRPWFERVWVFQESVVSAKVVFLLGTYYFPWDQVTRIAFLSLAPQLAERFSQITLKSFLLFARMNSFRYLYPEQKKIPLGLLIKEGSGAKCADPRDFVYSLLGMADVETTDLPVDYNLPVSTLFVRATRHIIHKHGNLAVLATVEDGVMIQDLPSWTPDWSFGTIRHCLDISPEVRKSYYNASKGYRHSINTRGDATNLAVNGKIIDTILEVLDHSFEDLQHDDLSGKYPVKKVFDNLLQFLKRESRWEPPHRTMLGAVVRTLIGGFILSMDDIHILHPRRLPPETDLSELLLDYSDNLISYPDSDNDRYFSNLKGQSFLESPELQVLTTRLIISSGICEKRRIVFNNRWAIGLAPRKAVPGDLIAILHGATAPCVLRPAEDAEEGCFRWVGNCYLDAAMQGEAVHWEEDAGDTFILI